MRKLLKAVAPTLFAFTLYIVYTGSVRLYDVLTGLIVSVLTGVTLSHFLVENWRKSLDVKRFLKLVKFVFRYFLVDEVRSHIEVIKLGFSPKMPIKPGIVRVPVKSRSDYALTLISLSITNTPGTVVVDLDKEKGVLYVNWIYVKTTDPKGCYENIARVFDEYAKRIFD